MEDDRIKELVQEAIESVEIRSDTDREEMTKLFITDCFAEKFLELVVQECILVIQTHAEHIYAEGTIEAIVNLEKHFGVD